MMKKYVELTIPASALLTMNAMVATGDVITFSGDVPADFAAFTTVSIADPVGDVGMPLFAPDGAVSGWEIEEVVFYLSMEDDMLQIGLNAFGIAGDVEGNGIDGNTAQWLLDLSGIDYPDLMSSESMGIAFDFDQDGFYDYIAGVSAHQNSHRVCEYAGYPEFPFVAFGDETPQYDGGHFYEPLPVSPDYELSVTGLEDLLVWDGLETCFDFLAFGGSIEDAGIGEEYVFGTVCLEDHTLTEIAVPDKIELSAYPNPFNPSTNVHFTLTETGPVTLNIYNLSGQLVSTLVDGNLPVGEHQFTFNAANLPSGVYIARINTTSSTNATRLVLLK